MSTYSTHTIKYAVVVVLSILTSGLWLSQVAQAQIVVEQLPNKDVYGDFVVGPGKQELIMQPGETRRVNIKVSNRIGEDRRFLVGIEDFTGSTDPNQTVLLMGSERGPYSLRDYIFPEVFDVMIEHGTRAVIPVVVSIPEDAEPGGRFGSVLVSTETSEVEGEGGVTSGAALVSRIGVLFFVRVTGDVVEEGELTGFTTLDNRRVFTASPVSFALEYKNTGSVHVNPYGVIEIKNLLGDVVGVEELEPWFALPGSVRVRQVEWGRPLLLGRYTATAQINRGYQDIVDTREVVFWILPAKPILIVIGIILFILLLVRFIFSKVEIRLK